jgi:hypothetical protein
MFQLHEVPLPALADISSVGGQARAGQEKSNNCQFEAYVL